VILITGATGPVGRETMKVLLANGAKVSGVTRDPSKATLPDGAGVIAADPSRPGTLADPLDGAEAILLSPRAVGAATPKLLALAAEKGVRRVVVVSAVTVEYPAGYPRFAEGFKMVEEAVRASGLQWTFLRCADFAANSLAWAPQIRSTGVVRGAYGEAATSPIHERDIAAVAAKALVDSAHAGQPYLLTGPESITQYDKVRIISDVIGKQVRFEELPPEHIRQGMLAAGLPEDVPDRLLGSLADYAKQPGPTSTTVEQILGRPALAFAEWVADNAAAFQG
jgi:uncharacterized protein YbjT (DUF2867 family)